MLLVLLLSVYVNPVKELFLLALFHVVSSTVFPKASAKVLLFSELTKFFTKYFQKIMLFHGLNDQNQGKKTIFGRYEQSIAGMRDKTNSAQGRKEKPYRKVKVTIRSFLKLYLIKAIPEVGIVLCRLSP